VFDNDLNRVLKSILKAPWNKIKINAKVVNNSAPLPNASTLVHFKTVPIKIPTPIKIITSGIFNFLKIISAKNPRKIIAEITPNT